MLVMTSAIYIFWSYLLSPFQPVWMSGVTLSSSLWNSSLALVTRSWYCVTILASDCAACTYRKEKSLKSQVGVQSVIL